MSPGKKQVRRRWAHSTVVGAWGRQVSRGFAINILSIEAQLAYAVSTETSPRLSLAAIHGMAAPRAVDPGSNSDGFESKIGHLEQNKRFQG